MGAGTAQAQRNPRAPLITSAESAILLIGAGIQHGEPLRWRRQGAAVSGLQGRITAAPKLTHSGRGAAEKQQNTRGM